jgi:hypothetical protein
MAERRRETLRRLAWFVALWAAGVLAVGGASYGLRALLF